MATPLFTIDPALFDDAAISEETRLFNENALAELSDLPDVWAVPPEQARRARLEGKGFFPLEKEADNANTIEIDTPDGPLAIRIIAPKSGTARGTYLHLHGGGWQVGAASAQDERLQEIAENTGLTCASVEYRLAPEHPFPAGPDDCERAALWLLDNTAELNTDFIAIGGESAGGHLTALTLLRMRDRHGLTPFHAAVLTAGVFDLGQTASARNWGSDKLVLNTRDMKMFATGFLQGGEDMRDPDVSPLFAALHDMPPALFSIGTKDLLLDDTLLMATRWHAANGNAQLDVTPGGCHVFQNLRHLKIAQQSNARIDAFLNGLIEKA